jgi:ABC-type Na+ efflux pump permease subunit
MLAHALRFEVALQLRSFVYPATVISTLVICAFIAILPLTTRSAELAAFFVYMDPATIGLSFVGAIVLKEKAQGTLAALGVTPLRPWIYVAAKTVSLTALAFLSGVVVAYMATGGAFDVARMLFAIALASTLAVQVGFACVARAPSMNKLSITLLWVSMLGYLPLLAHFELAPAVLTPAFAVIPSYAMLTLFTGAVDGSDVSTEQWWLAVAYVTAWCALGAWWTLREYTRELVSDGK